MTRFVHYYPDALGDSGVTVALWGWALALAAAGHEVLVLHAGARSARYTPESFVTTRGAPVEDRAIAHRGRGRALRHPVALGRHLRAGDLLVLHEGWVTANVVAAAAARRRSIPYVVVPHGVHEPAWRRYLRPPRAVRSAVERRVLEGAAAVHLFFASEAAAVLALAPAARLVVAPTGIELPSDRWRGGGGYLAWVGRYDPVHKGLDVLLDAIGLLPADRRPRITLHGYDYRGGVARFRKLLARRPGLDGIVTMGGPISGGEKRRFLLEADGYVLPSRWESHSVALLEVLSLGIPSLVSSRLHVAPVLERHHAAVLAAPDAPSLAAALPSVGGDAALGARARAMVGEEFAWGRVLPGYLDQLATLGLVRS